ncbi:MAG: aldolase [Clostridiales bacterium]|nr:aldolase [Clostridiales bacterium]
MALTLMYITNNELVADIAQRAGVDRIWIDMEYIGKEERQAGMNTVKSHHTIDDIVRLRPIVKTSKLMVRVNPLHQATKDYCSSKEEIENTLTAGAEVIMLPMFRTRADAEKFVEIVDGRAKVQLLLETAEAAAKIKEICKVQGVDEIHIGLNDLHLAYGQKFMFQLLADGTVERLCKTIKENGIKYGFGGIARVGYGMLPAEYIMAEHYRLGSTAAILSRGFCDANLVEDPKTIEDIFLEGVKNIRLKEIEFLGYTEEQFKNNHAMVVEKVNQIVALKS